MWKPETRFAAVTADAVVGNSKEQAAGPARYRLQGSRACVDPLAGLAGPRYPSSAKSLGIEGIRLLPNCPRLAGGLPRAG